ncbi:MAG: hypothetical protein IKE74_10285 [Mogibacterium sp.]|nr:hypothetical protein [Mogibacterium sp.]
MKKNSYFSKILALLCAVAMVITMMPLGLMSRTESYAVDQTAPEASANSEEGAGEEEKKPAQEESKPAQEEAKPAQEEAGSEKTDPEPETGKDDASGKETDKAAAEPKKEEAQADSNADRTAEEKAEDNKAEGNKAEGKKAEEKSFKAEFDFGENYARFSAINPKTTDNDGEIKLPEKPEARKKVYEARDGKKYYFTGWKYKGDEYEPGDKVTLKADAEFTAVWKQTYTIQFSAKGIEADKVEDQIAVYGEPVVLPDETASKEGMDFVGWTPDQGKTVYEAGKEIKAEKIEPERTSAKSAMVKLRGEIEDNTAPQIKIVAPVNPSNEGKADINISATDASGVKTLQYYISDSEVSEPSSITAWVDAPSSSIQVDDGKYLVVKAVDSSENENTAYKQRRIDLQNIKAGGAPDVNITTSATDAAVASKSHTVTFENTGAEIDIVEVSVGGELISGLTGDSTTTSFTISEETTGKSLNGNIVIQISATGIWGGVSSDSITCAFDNTAPEVTLGMSETHSYYKADNCGMTASSSASDLASLALKAQLGTSADEIELGSVTTSTCSLSAATVANKLGAIEGNVTITAVATDNAGNTGETTLAINYDAAAPKLVSVTTAKSSSVVEDNYYYYDAAAATTYTIEDSNPSVISLTYKKDGATASGTADSSKKKITGNWNSQGMYTEIKLYAEDLAGNKLVIGENFNPKAEDTVDGTAANGYVNFKYGKVVDTRKPTVTVTYDTEVSPVTNQKAKMHLYNESGKLRAYVSGNVKVASVRIEDNNLLWVKNHIHWETEKGTIQTLKPEDIKTNAEEGYQYAELENIALLTEDGDAAYHIYGSDIIHSLEVTEKTSLGVEVVSHGGTSWPTGSKKVRLATDSLQISFTRDIVSPVYTSTFSEVEDAADNTEETAGGEYTAYYGDTTKVGGKIDAAFEVVDANLDNDETWAKTVYKTGDDYSKVTPSETDAPETMSFVSQGDNKYSCQKTVSGTDGVYRFYVYGVDKAGNTLVMSSDEETKAAVAGSGGYNKTIQCSINEPGKFRSFSKVLDTEAPGYGLKISDEDMDGYLVKYGNVAADKQDIGTDGTYKPFRKNKTATVLAKGYDASPVKLQYRFTSVDANSESTEWTDSELFTSNGYPDAKTLTKDKEGETQFRVKDLKVADKAGNATELSESNTVYLDGTSPEGQEDIIKPEVSITSATKSITHHDTGYELYNTDVDLKFTVTDPYKNKSSSGLQHVWYTLSVDGTPIASEKLIKPNDEDYFDKGDLLMFGKADMENAVKEKGDEALTYSIDRTITIPKGVDNGYETNDIVVTLYAVDNSDNEAVPAVKGLGIDSVAPEVYVSLTRKASKGNKYFNENRTATIKVIDRNLGEKSKKIKIDTQIDVPESWTYTAGDNVSGNKDEWIKKLHYNKDGDYTLAVSGEDALGNRATDANIHWEGEHPKEFTIDKTNPTIKVTFDNNSVRNQKYYKANRTATITIVEHNFYDPDVKTAGSAKAPRKKAMGFPGRTKFSSKGDTRKSNIYFNKEGNFAFDVSYTDLAGNPAKTVKIPEFVIDKTPPVVKIENVDANNIYSGAIAPRASFEDDNFDRNNSKFSFTGARSGDRSDLAGGMKENEYGGVYTMSDFARIRKNDDIYTASATSTDMAGNNTSVSLSFSVNRFGSTYDYDGDTDTISLVSKKSGRYYTNKPQALVLREINVNPLKNYKLTLYKDDTSSTLKKGADYRVEERTVKGGYQYVYYINEDLITDEGSYNIVATSEDEAGNMNTNASIRTEEGVEEVPVKFVYDTTLPTVSFLDLSENNKVITLKENGSTLFRGMSSLDLGVRPDDDWALSAIEIGIRSSNAKKGQLFGPTKYEGEEFWEYMGEDKQKYFEEIIKSGSDTKFIDITIWDAAGNESKQTYKVLVTANIFELMLHYWYIVLAILAVIAGGAYYYARRKKNQEEGKAEQQQ